MINYQDHALLLNETYKRWFGEYLVVEKDPGLVLNAINEADVMLLSVGLEQQPVFNYGNVKSLLMFGCDLAELVQQVAIEAVPEDLQTEEQAALSKVAEEGAVAEYHSQRITPKQKRWHVRDGKIWTLKDSLGRFHGLAYCFKDWCQA